MDSERPFDPMITRQITSLYEPYIEELSKAMSELVASEASGVSVR